MTFERQRAERLVGLRLRSATRESPELSPARTHSVSTARVPNGRGEESNTARFCTLPSKKRESTAAACVVCKKGALLV